MGLALLRSAIDIQMITCSKMRHPDMRDIISGFEGTVRPGEMLRMPYL